MRRVLPILIALCCVPALADETERDAIFTRFDHAQHEKILAKNEISCVSCHQVGAKSEGTFERGQLAAAYLLPPEGACHQCHAPGEGNLGAGAGVQAAPQRCATCHTHVTPPDSHDASWLSFHGREAATDASGCRDCHARATCTECHDRRETVTYEVHDPTWLSVHGVAARAAPAECDTCHVQQECTSCHSSSAAFGRSR